MIVCFIPSAPAQISPSYTQFFVNPYHFNPSYAGIEGRPTLFLYHRRQWVGIEGAPVTTSLSFHTPLTLGLSLGLDINNDSRGILGTNSGLVTVGYAVPFNKTTFLRFGISAGAGFRMIDLDLIENPLDPALAGIVDQNVFLAGNFGLSFQTGYFNFGASLPNLFEPDIGTISSFSFDSVKFSPVNEMIFNASYRFYFAEDNVAFEPQVLYRYATVGPGQYEAAGILHLKNLVWLGGSFRQDYGISAFAGIKIANFLSFGYGYGIGSKSLPGIGNSTHEVLLTLFAGKQKKAKKKDSRLYLSFIDASKYVPPKPEKKPVVVTKPIVKPDTIIQEVVIPKDTVKALVSQEEQKPVKDTVSVVREDTIPVIQQVVVPKDTIPVRHEFARQLNDSTDLIPGSYIIIGVYNYKENAERMIGQVATIGYTASTGYVSERGHWYVYVWRENTPDEARRHLPTVRDRMKIQDAWMLTIYDGDQAPGVATMTGLPEEPSDTVQVEELSEERTRVNEMMMTNIGAESGVEVEVFKRGNDMFELLPGNYIVTGVFETFEAAEKNSDDLYTSIGQKVKWGYLTGKKAWYSYVYFDTTAAGIKEELENVRKVPQFRDAWLLAVQ
jgi:type IX secretion system PorP/SprF family membrane protein